MWFFTFAAVQHHLVFSFLDPDLFLSHLVQACVSCASGQLEADARQWSGKSENPPSVKTWRRYHNTVKSEGLPPSPFSSSFPRTLALPRALTDPGPLIYLLCLRQQAVFAERLSARQPLLTSDPGSPTCPPGHTHALFTPLVLLGLSASDVKGFSVSAD